MPSYLCVSVRFLNGTFHGRRDGGEPEWPPSPLRLFQALVAASAAKCGDAFDERAAAALRWLEQQPAPTIIAPRGELEAPYRLSVPNNALDLVARAWVRGNLDGSGDANPATHRAMKVVQPTRVGPEDAVSYLWQLPDGASNDVLGYMEWLTIASRSLVALGWGVDLIAGSATVISPTELEQLGGEVWIPQGDLLLRAPHTGTLRGLCERHQAFLSRLPPEGGFRPVPPLSEFAVVGYRRELDPPKREIAAFQLLRPEADGMRAYHPGRNMRRVVGMMRDAVRRATQAAGWPEEKIARFVLGHAESKGARHQPVTDGRFAFLPIPTIEGRGAGKKRVVGAIRRVLLTSFEQDAQREITWARRAMSGLELIDESRGVPDAVLSLIPETDPRLKDYLKPAATWSTVTPMVLPGYDDRRHSKADELIRKAICQAGFAPTLAQYAELEWRKVGFRPGCDLAMRYQVPHYLQNFPRYHVRITWCNAAGETIALRGPICIGGGRHFGFGLFAAVAE